MARRAVAAEEERAVEGARAAEEEREEEERAVEGAAVAGARAQLHSLQLHLAAAALPAAQSKRPPVHRPLQTVLQQDCCCCLQRRAPFLAGEHRFLQREEGDHCCLQSEQGLGT